MPLQTALGVLIGGRGSAEVAADVASLRREGLVCAAFVPNVAALPRDAAEAARRLARTGVIILGADGAPVGRWEAK